MSEKLDGPLSKEDGRESGGDVSVGGSGGGFQPAGCASDAGTKGAGGMSSFWVARRARSSSEHRTVWASVAVAFYFALTIHGPPGGLSPAFQPVPQEGGFPGFAPSDATLLPASS